MFGLAGILAAVAAAQAQNWNFQKIDPKSTYLRDSQATAPVVVIEFVGLYEFGDFLELRTVGWFNRAADNPAAHNVSDQAVAVFSSTGLLDPDWNNQFRVGGAAKAGTDFYTLPTFVGNKPTDIQEDFGIGPDIVRIQIPEAGRYLMFTPYDNGFWNNVDDFSMPGADPRGFGIEWRGASAVPEPGALAALAVGLATLRARRRRRA